MGCFWGPWNREEHHSSVYLLLIYFFFWGVLRMVLRSRHDQSYSMDVFLLFFFRCCCCFHLFDSLKLLVPNSIDLDELSTQYSFDVLLNPHSPLAPNSIFHSCRWVSALAESSPCHTSPLSFSPWRVRSRRTSHPAWPEGSQSCPASWSQDSEKANKAVP